MNKEILYPIKFVPILQSKIWGGKKLVTEFNKNSKLNSIGESWELSGVEGFVSEVSNGELKGERLTSLIKKHTTEFVGKKVFEKFGLEFPLLFKFIDAADNLSIQLHPNDILAKKRHNSFGKTEMWYVMSADKDAVLYVGFNKKLTKKSYLEEFEKGNILDLICQEKVKTGDSFFVEVGTIHAIGKGILIAEIQQTSDITYRVYDWDRKDEKGKERQLHTDLAIDALDFDKIGACKISYSNKKNNPNQIYSCEYFTTNKIFLSEILRRDLRGIDSFIVYMCVEGSFEIFINNKKEKVEKGETILIPALVEEVILDTSVYSELLEVYID